MYLKKNVPRKKRTQGEQCDPDKNERDNNVCVCDGDTHEDLFSEISSSWSAIAGRPIVWNVARRGQILGLLPNYPEDRLLLALQKYKKIRDLKDAYIPRSWTFEAFFSVKVLDEVLDQPLDHFRRFSKSRRRGAPPGSETPTSKYNPGGGSSHEEE